MNILESFQNRIKGEKDWFHFYPKNKRQIKMPNMSLYEYLYKENRNHLKNIAINYMGNKMTYNTLFKEINRCAKAMRSQGIREGDVVSICMANTPEAIISFYAVSKIGAISNMIHPLSAEEEIKASLIETNTVMLITLNQTYTKLKDIMEETSVYKTVLVSPKDSMPTLLGLGYFLLEDRKVNVPKSTEKFISWKNFMLKGNKYDKNVFVSRHKNDDAVILHSGGTTGVPKHIVLTNGNINIVVGQARIFLKDATDEDNFLSILPLFHCFGLVEGIHYPLCCGQTAILVPKFDASRFDKLITKYHPTIIPGVPTLFEALISNKHMEDVDMTDVKYIVSGGDTLSEEKNIAVNKFLRTHGCQNPIVQGYGMTETSGGVILGGLGSDKMGSVGIPLVGNNVKIIDIETGEECPRGKTGEILLSGPSVMKKYLNNPEETNKVIETDKQGTRWVHTGDAGYLDEDNILFFVQRIKRMIIVSGYNVFPAHIEEILLKHEKIKNCCVIGIPHPYKIQVPKAYIVLKDGVQESAIVRREIKAYCEKELSKYMIPKEFVYRDSLPKTLVGKVDFKALEKESLEEQKKEA
ncbi:MAG: acyl--CoA ligase [Bacilli bacterium]|nr:acyl--CoA ligase [Bacilli bacterium]